MSFAQSDNVIRLMTPTSWANPFAGAILLNRIISNHQIDESLLMMSSFPHVNEKTTKHEGNWEMYPFA